MPLVLYGRGGNSNTPDVFMPCWHPYYANAYALLYCCRMPPTRQSARPKTRAARRRSRVVSTAAPVHPSDRAVASTAVPAPPIDPSERATAAKPTGTARQRWEADVMNRLDATEHLSREMHEMRSLLESRGWNPLYRAWVRPAARRGHRSQQLHHRNKGRDNLLPLMVGKQRQWRRRHPMC